jgi:signal transduction histidine kinase
LVQVTLPAVLIGLILFGTSLIGVWSIRRLEASHALIISKNVRSLQAALEMEIRLRQLRFHSLIYLMGPTPERRQSIEEDHHKFEEALEAARYLANLPGEKDLVQAIDEGYTRYRAELDLHPRPRTPGPSRDDSLRWADAHPVHHLLEPCEKLLGVNRQAMETIASESEAVGEQGRASLILLGVLGPIGGLIGGFGVAWGLSRSITRLSVRLQDATAQLDQDLGSVRLIGEGDLTSLDRQLEEVTERVREVVARSQRQQQEMLRAEQLAAVGQLAASVAHEVRNPLTGVKLLVGAALWSRPPKALSPEDLQVIHDEISSLEGKVQALLDFARPPALVRESCDLRDLVTRALELVRARVRQINVQMDVDLPEEPVTAEVDGDQITGVLVNLFLNALDAMPHGGRLSVSLRQDPSGTVRLTVADTGHGIDPAVAARLFTPFTSTKKTGTGLGLSISRRAVSEHGGSLTGVNRPGGGACFTVTLPAQPAEACHAHAAGR